MNKIHDALLSSLEMSLYYSPENEGLTKNEIFEILTKLDYQKVEIGDALIDMRNGQNILPQQGNLFRINPDTYHYLWIGIYKTDFEPVAPDLMDYILKYFDSLIKELGKSQAKLERNILISRLISAGYAKKESILAVKLLVYGRLLKSDNENIISLSPNKVVQMSYSDYVNQNSTVTQRPILNKLKSIVSDIIDRRTDGRLTTTDPLDAFGQSLEKLKHTNFKIWWHATQREWQSLSPVTSPKSFLVLSAALCEGMLALTTEIAQENNWSMSKRLGDKPTSWRFHNLIDAACTGSNPVIADDKLKHSLLELNEYRKIIHAGALIDKYKKATIPDVRSEESALSKENVLKLSRCIVDWLQKNNV